MSQPPEPPYGYGSPPPPGLGGRPTLVAPGKVQRAAQCLYALAALQVIGLVLSLLSTDSAADAIRESDSSLTDSEVSTVVAIGLVFSAVLTLAFAGLWLLCARKMLAGRNWARIVGTVLTGLLIVLNAIALAGSALVEGSDAFASVITVVGLALSVGFMIFAWNRESNDFFAASAAQPV